MSLAQALHSDWAAMGLAHYQPGQNAFTAKAPVSTATPPKKRGPRPSRAGAISKETFEDRQARLRAKILKDNTGRTSFNVDLPKPGDAIKTAKIRGRSNDSRTQ
jgi:hypothetical protein